MGKGLRPPNLQPDPLRIYTAYQALTVQKRIRRWPRACVAQRMGQRLARQDVDEGVKLYHLQKHQQAIERWRIALRKLKGAEDRFITMGYLAQAHCEAGRFKDMLVYALHQIDMANEHNDSYMRAEAYLNLARANERLCEFHKAISYGRQSLNNQSMDPRTPGYAYLCIASAYLGFSHFQMGLENYEQAMQIAHSTQDRLLELQICVGLGTLFTHLKDITKALVFLKNALSLLGTVSIEDVQAKYKSIILYHLTVALTKKGSLADAKTAVEEALKLATDNGNRPIQGRCLHALGDIHREYRDAEKSWSRYEASYSLFNEIEDQLGQMLVLSSMSKAAVQLPRPDAASCECQAISLNKKCLEISKTIGCKLSMLKCHSRMADLYQRLNDEESEEVSRRAVMSLTQEMELFCNFCGQRFGNRQDALQALTCSHIFHERCLHHYLRARDKKHCPKCVHRAALLKTPPQQHHITSPTPNTAKPTGPMPILVHRTRHALDSYVPEDDENQPSTSGYIPPRQQSFEDTPKCLSASASIMSQSAPESSHVPEGVTSCSQTVTDV